MGQHIYTVYRYKVATDTAIPVAMAELIGTHWKIQGFKEFNEDALSQLPVDREVLTKARARELLNRTDVLLLFGYKNLLSEGVYLQQIDFNTGTFKQINNSRHSNGWSLMSILSALESDNSEFRPEEKEWLIENMKGKTYFQQYLDYIEYKNNLATLSCLSAFEDMSLGQSTFMIKSDDGSTLLYLKIGKLESDEAVDLRGISYIPISLFKSFNFPVIIDDKISLDSFTKLQYYLPELVFDMSLKGMKMLIDSTNLFRYRIVTLTKSNCGILYDYGVMSELIGEGIDSTSVAYIGEIVNKECKTLIEYLDPKIEFDEVSIVVNHKAKTTQLLVRYENLEVKAINFNDTDLVHKATTLNEVTAEVAKDIEKELNSSVLSVVNEYLC